MGNGRVQTELRQLPAFHSLALSSSGSVSVHRGDFRVELSADSNILPYMLTEVVGGELIIGLRPGVTVINPSKLHYEISMPELSGFKISGSGKAEVDAFEGQDLRLVLSGSGSLQGDFSYEKADLLVSGSGKARLSAKLADTRVKLTGSGGVELIGASDSLDLLVSGSGRFDGVSFPVGRAQAKLAGSGSAELRVAETLDAQLSGSGRLSYWGKAQVESSVVGSGKLRRLGD